MIDLIKKPPPLFWFSVSLWGGILFSSLFFFDLLTLTLFYTFFLAVFVICTFFNLVSKRIWISVMALVFFLTGMILYKPFESLDEGNCTIVGKIYRVTDSSIRLTQVKALEEDVWQSKSGEFYALIPDYSEVKENDYLAINGVNSKLGNLNFIRSFLPGDSFSYPYRETAYERLRLNFQSFSNSFVTFLKEQVGDDNGAIASAVFFGLGLDSQNKDTINKAGISYLFVVSGFHFFLVYFLFSWVIAFFKPGNHLFVIVKLVFLTLFFLTCSTGPSSFRAFLMLFLYEVFKAMDYPVSPLSVLGLSAIIILFKDPAMALNAGFQMTYGAVLGILIVSKLKKSQNRMYQWLVPLGSLIFIMPITAIQFGVIPLLAIPVGLLISLTLIPFIMLCLFIAIILFALQLFPLARIILIGLNPLLTLSRAIIQWLSVHYGTVSVNQTGSTIVGVSALIIFILLVFFHQKRSVYLSANNSKSSQLQS